MAVIETLIAGRTVLLISHNERPPAWADKVVRLDHGRLSERPSRLAGPVSVLPGATALPAATA